MSVQVNVTLHGYQIEAVDRALETNGLLVVSPTGTGKSYMINEEFFRRMSMPGKPPCIIVPSPGIRNDMCDKSPGLTPFIFTPITFRNRLMDGLVDPGWLIFDEAHHTESNTHKLIIASVDRECGFTGYTATPYRGTLSGTFDLLATYKHIHHAITQSQAVKQGFIRMPDIEIWPLLDDEKFSIKDGEFDVEELSFGVNTIMDDVIERWKCLDSRQPRPTVFGCPTTDIAREMANRLETIAILADTPMTTRRKLFDDCLAGGKPLIHVNVIGEGIDLKLGCYIDLAPTLSPVLFHQRFGRIRRVDKNAKHPPLYICTNHNVTRHAYTLEDTISREQFAKISAAFEGVAPINSVRYRMRLAGLGRVQPVMIVSVSGVCYTTFMLQQSQGDHMGQLAVMIDPLRHDFYTFRRRYEGPDKKNKWQVNYESQGTTLDGYAGMPSGSNLSPNQVKWYQQQAKRQGIDIEKTKLTRRVFDFFVALSDSGLRLL
jgi:hypothetical protein